ncbi:PIG-L deacetylase family protein [Saxibacter everestensis]|uniref:PIG-L deacetylase family protein n=1 Tax=Saxibacter everestensis TaxID=2909229 RepID=A0ABY8QTI1_9MICO|nr:PIG-L deacetylase family protein [Brevibacteriaceae bacterium ZFBP1038]
MVTSLAPAFDAQQPGTPLAEWQGWQRTFSEFSLGECDGLVVVAPHPDDEVLGAGGIMAQARDRGIEVTVVAVTDGDGSHPGSRLYGAGELARVRARESEHALGLLGVRAAARLGLRDGQVAAEEDRLVGLIADVLRNAPPNALCLTSWRHDGHPDHEATGRASVRAAALAGVRCMEYPVWMWHWAGPEHPAVPWERAEQATLSADVHRRKAEAVAQFRSQLSPDPTIPQAGAVLGPHVIERFLHLPEVVFSSGAE